MQVHVDQTLIDKLDAMSAWMSQHHYGWENLPDTYMYRMGDDSIVCNSCVDQFGEAHNNQSTIRVQFDQLGEHVIDADDADFDIEGTVIGYEEFSATIGRCGECGFVYGDLYDLELEAAMFADSRDHSQ